MTIFAFDRLRLGARSRLALLAATALSLAACSGSFDRFADYPDVNTSSLPTEAGTGEGEGPVAKAALPPSRPAWQNAPDNAGTDRAGTVVVESGQTLYSIARANGMTADRLAAANNIPPPYAIRVGQTLTVPGRANSASPQKIQAAYAPAEQPELGREATHTVKPGETLFAIGRTYGVEPFAIAEHNRLPKPYSLNTGQTLRIPPSSSGASLAQNPAEPNAQVAGNPPAAPKPPGLPTPQAEAMEAPQATAQQSDGPAGNVGFRWPVKGRVVSTFGQKPNGMRNEGINIAVPEGASVRAAESGVVAYAGNELKGYGNLVLIRHDDGWVTAYAHNKELFVNRGETVKRGDIIAKAGQTGSVTSPQLHFELRKGATAVDPMKHLGSQQAMN